MNSKILLISLITLILFSGCIENEAESLGEDFLDFEGNWSWTGEQDEISFNIAEDGTGTYSEALDEGANFECSAFVYIDNSSITFACKGISLSREFDVIEASTTSMKLSHSKLEEELTFIKMK